MKLNNLLIIIIIIILLGVSGTISYYSFHKVVFTQRSEYIFSVTNHVGLVGDRDAIKFGGVGAGGWGNRYINFSNDYEFPIKIKIKIKGEKSEWISVSENDFILDQEETKKVKITVTVPEYASYHENYTGIVTAHHIRT